MCRQARWASRSPNGKCSSPESFNVLVLSSTRACWRMFQSRWTGVGVGVVTPVPVLASTGTTNAGRPHAVARGERSAGYRPAMRTGRRHRLVAQRPRNASPGRRCGGVPAAKDRRVIGVDPADRPGLEHVPTLNEHGLFVHVGARSGPSSRLSGRALSANIRCSSSARAPRTPVRPCDRCASHARRRWGPRRCGPKLSEAANQWRSGVRRRLPER